MSQSVECGIQAAKQNSDKNKSAFEYPLFGDSGNQPKDEKEMSVRCYNEYWIATHRDDTNTKLASFGILSSEEYDRRLRDASPVDNGDGGDYYVVDPHTKTKTAVLMAGGKQVLHENNYEETLSAAYVQFVAETGLKSIRGHKYSFSAKVMADFALKKVKELLLPNFLELPCGVDLDNKAESFKANPNVSAATPSTSTSWTPSTMSSDMTSPTNLVGRSLFSTMHPEPGSMTPMTPFEKKQVEAETKRLDLEQHRFEFEKQQSERHLDIHKQSADSIGRLSKTVEGQQNTINHLVTQGSTTNTGTKSKPKETTASKTARSKTPTKPPAKPPKVVPAAVTETEGKPVINTSNGQTGRRKKRGSLLIAINQR